MRLAEQIGLGEEERSSLFYALLLKDAGCSSNAARLSSLFAADDHETKRAMKVTDWSRPGSLAMYTWRSVASGGGPLAKARVMRRVTQEEEVRRELIGTRCERGAEIARMLELPDDTAQAIRALDEHWDGAGRVSRSRRDCRVSHPCGGKVDKPPANRPRLTQCRSWPAH